jgi:ketosteroid isomerase-like protein
MRAWILKLAVAAILATGVVTGARAQQPASKAQQPPPLTDDAAIRAALDQQVTAWNNGDIPGFMETYEKSPETTFVGTSTINKGFDNVLQRYVKGYPNKDVMGILTFSKLEIRMLPSSNLKTDYAIVIGHFHLERVDKGEGTKDDGIFSLVWHKGQTGWKILLDHTS